jgi:hypothetical protein
LEYPGVEGRIIIKWILKKWNGMVWTRLIWLRIGAGGGLLWMREWTFRFHKMWGISWLAENRLASQEGLCCVEWVSILRQQTVRAVTIATKRKSTGKGKDRYRAI